MGTYCQGLGSFVDNRYQLDRWCEGKPLVPEILICHENLLNILHNVNTSRCAEIPLAKRGALGRAGECWGGPGVYTMCSERFRGNLGTDRKRAVYISHGRESLSHPFVLKNPLNHSRLQHRCYITQDYSTHATLTWRFSNTPRSQLCRYRLPRIVGYRGISWRYVALRWVSWGYTMYNAAQCTW